MGQSTFFNLPGLTAEDAVFFVRSLSAEGAIAYATFVNTLLPPQDDVLTPSSIVEMSIEGGEPGRVGCAVRAPP